MSVFRSSGGGSITGLIKAITFDTKEWPAKKKGGEDYTTVSAQLEILPDGQKDTVKRFIPAGFFYPDSMSIDADTEQLVSDNANPLQSGTEFEKFVLSAIEKDFDMAEVEASEGKDWTSFNGIRAKLTNVVDVEATKEFGKRKGKGANKGKEFNRTYLVVSEILGKEDVKASGKKGSTKAAPKADAKGKGKAAPAADDLTDTAKGMLYDLLGEAKNNSIVKGTLNSLTMKYAGDNGWDNAQRDAVRKIVTSNAFLKEEDGWSFDGKTVAQA